MIDRRRFFLALGGAVAMPAISSAKVLDGPSPSDSKKELSSDPLRPQFHLLPRANWMNDPNGPVFWKGNYHMFYQHNPGAAVWGDMHWGHAISKDMVHWRHLPIALAPTPSGPDSEGCFTGTALVQDGKVHLMYTGVRSAPEEKATIKDGQRSLRESQCLAVSEDSELRTWAKVKDPIIANPPPGLLVNGFRDPSPWRQGEWWYTVIGSGIANRGGAVLLYRSKDLHHWEYMHVLANRGDHAGPVNPWESWECPEFFPLGERHVLICSTMGKSYWQCGKFDPEQMTFRPEQEGILDYGSYYAPKTQLDENGNRILWGWIQESRPVEEYRAAGWASLMSLPRVLTATEDGRIRIDFARETETLRKTEQALHLSADEKINLDKISDLRLENCCGEMLLILRGTAKPFEAQLVGEDDGTPWLRISYDPNSADPVCVDARPIPLKLETQDFEFHLYIDGSVIELLVNRQIAWTKRFYYPGEKAQNARLKWRGKTESIVRLSCWQVSPISNDRLTS